MILRDSDLSRLPIWARALIGLLLLIAVDTVVRLTLEVW